MVKGNSSKTLTRWLSTTSILVVIGRMELSEKPKTFCRFYVAFLESTLNFEHYELKKKRAS